MHPIVTKSVMLIGVLVLSNNIGCDYLYLQPMSNQSLYGVAGCTVDCLQKANLSDCYTKCADSNQTVELTPSINDEKVELLCRDDQSLTIEMNSTLVTSSTAYDEWKDKRYLLLLELEQNADHIKFVYFADSPLVQIEHLRRNTTYSVKCAIFSADYTYRQLVGVEHFRTLEHDDYTPEMIANNTIDVKYTSENDSLLTHIKWKPTRDFICNYHYYLVAGKEKAFADSLPLIFKKLKVTELYHLKTQLLNFESEYVFEIVGTNVNETKEGVKCTYKFTTPSCWNVSGISTNICPPHHLTNISSTHERLESGLYRIYVTWKKPDLHPHYYNVSLNLNSKGNVESQNVSGSQNHVYFPEVNITDVHYDVTIVAYSMRASTENSKFFDLEMKPSFFNRYELTVSVISILLPFVVLLSIFFVCLLVKNQRCSIEHKKEMYSKELYLRKITQAYDKDEMEINPINVELYEVLGEGAFGIVRKGVLKPSNTPIAVKMLKENADIEDIKAFLSEINLMKSVGQHANIVGIVGHSTKQYNKMMLLTEYCSEGNLLDYLRKFRDAYQLPMENYSPDQWTISAHTSSDKSPESIFNFDSKFINKFTVADKAIPMLNTKRDNSTIPLVSSHSRCNDSEQSTPRITSDPYQANCMQSMHANATNQLDDKGDAIFDALKNGVVQFIYSENREYFVETKTDRDTPLFAANQAYGIFPSAPNCAESHKQNIDDEAEEVTSNDKTTFDQLRGNCLTDRDLLMFARQIAIGMEFLANNKIVHRDLAARNVLVCTDKTIKIADFGLSRDIYVDNIYLKASAGRLPLKWLALESMTDQKYTSQSDVWSYGILLYEIVTLGGTPYPTVPPDCLISYLKSGNRMTKPDACNHEFYEMMLSCWHCNSCERPTFSEILRKVDAFIQQTDANAEVIRINNVEETGWSNKSVKIENICNNSTYLTPL